MNRPRSRLRVLWTIAGGAAAVALAVRGVQDLQAGESGALLLVAAAAMTAVLLRLFVYRD